MEWMFMPFKRYVDFQGRSRRKEYWMFALFVGIVVTILYIILGIMLAAALASMTVDPDTGMVTGAPATGGMGILLVSAILWIFCLAIFLPSLAVAVRRMHDQDKSGWFILIPIYSLILLCMPGTPGPNRFGPDPLGGGGDPSGTFN